MLIPEHHHHYYYQKIIYEPNPKKWQYKLPERSNKSVMRSETRIFIFDNIERTNNKKGIMWKWRKQFYFIFSKINIDFFLHNTLFLEFKLVFNFFILVCFFFEFKSLIYSFIHSNTRTQPASQPQCTQEKNIYCIWNLVESGFF